MGLFAFLGFNCLGSAHQLFEYCPPVEELWFPLARCNPQDRGKIAAQHDHQLRTIGHKINAADLEKHALWLVLGLVDSDQGLLFTKMRTLPIRRGLSVDR